MRVRRPLGNDTANDIIGELKRYVCERVRVCVHLH